MLGLRICREVLTPTSCRKDRNKKRSLSLSLICYPFFVFISCLSRPSERRLVCLKESGERDSNVSVCFFLSFIVALIVFTAGMRHLASQWCLPLIARCLACLTIDLIAPPPRPPPAAAGRAGECSRYVILME